MNEIKKKFINRKQISRRSFNSGVVAAGSLAAAGFNFSISKVGMSRPDLAVAHGPDAAKNVRSAVDLVGGMGAFVSSGQSVGLLLNAMGRVPAAYTKQEVLSTVVQMCKEAGASEVRVLSWLEQERRQMNSLDERVPQAGAIFHHVDQHNPELWQRFDVPRGKILSEIRLFKVLFEPDVLITLPLFKHHVSAHFSGAIKLALAASPRADNRQYLHREKSKYLEQCIADMNTIVRPPDLIIMDAMEVLTSGGPRGPGKTVSPQKIVVGTDRVAVDAYCAPIQGFTPEDSIQIRAAAELGVGEADLSKLTIQTVEVEA